MQATIKSSALNFLGNSPWAESELKEIFNAIILDVIDKKWHTKRAFHANEIITFLASNLLTLQDILDFLDWTGISIPTYLLNFKETSPEDFDEIIRICKLNLLGEKIFDLVVADVLVIQREDI